MTSLFQHGNTLASSEWRKNSGKMRKFLHKLILTSLSPLIPYTWLTFLFFKSKLFRSLRWSSDFLNDQFEIWFLEVQFHIMVDPQLVYISAEEETAFIHIRASTHWKNFHPHKTVRSTVPEIIQPLNPLQRE